MTKKIVSPKLRIEVRKFLIFKSCFNVFESSRLGSPRLKKMSITFLLPRNLSWSVILRNGIYASTTRKEQEGQEFRNFP